MINLDGIIGDIIFISFREIERFKEIGISKTSGHFLLKGYDQMGLWLEHTGIAIKHTEDDKGRPIPAEKQTQENITAVFMVQWNNINTMMHYPDRAGFDFPNEFQKDIGFRFKEKEKLIKK